jgi:hypothetical protein
LPRIARRRFTRDESGTGSAAITWRNRAASTALSASSSSGAVVIGEHYPACPLRGTTHFGARFINVHGGNLVVRQSRGRGERVSRTTATKPTFPPAAHLARAVSAPWLKKRRLADFAQRAGLRTIYNFLRTRKQPYINELHRIT